MVLRWYQGGEAASAVTGTSLQLIFVIGDGRIDKERPAVQTLIRQVSKYVDEYEWEYGVGIRR